MFPVCIGEIFPEGDFLVYTQPNEGVVKVVATGGSPLSTLTAPASDYVGPAVFGPTGDLAFVSATLSETGGEAEELPVPNPGYISFVGTPYTAEPEILLADNRVATIWEWINEAHLAYGSIDEAGNIGTSIVTADGHQNELSTNFALTVLR